MDAHQHTIPRDSDLTQGYALSGKVMLTSVITLFVVVLLIVCFHLYTRWFVRLAHRRHRRRLFHRAAVNRLSLSTARGLHPSLLTSLPTFVYSASSATSAMECAVCLSEFEEGETGRVLPKCSHSFHIECIDTWFKSRSSCPLCRAPVRLEPGRVDREEVAVQVSNSESGAGSSTGSESLRLPPPVECPRKTLETVEVVVEMGGNWSEQHRMAGSNSRVNDDGLSLKRFVSI